MGLLDSVIGSVTGSGQGSSGSSSSPTSPMVKALLLLLAAGEPGTIQSGVLKGFPSLESLMERFTKSGHGDKVQSWVGPGENRPIQPQELQQALGPDQIDHLQRETGLPRDQLLSQLSKVLPQVVDKLTPHGRLPTPEERARW
jgi:uncharacterized protein YidB (DUF937 family)